jgi:hypothetical protein
MSLGVIATLTAVGVATNVISRKIAGDPDMPAQIGSGTSPSLSPGPEMDIAPVAGSEVQEFGDFQFENLAKPEDGQQEMILNQLQQAGVDVADLDQYGLAGMAVGGYLNRANGGNINLGIGNLTGEDDLLKALQEAGLVSADAPEMTTGVLDVDFSEIEMPDPEDLMEEQMFADLSPEITPPELPEMELSRLEKMEQFIEGQDPMVSAAMYKGLGDIGTAIFQRLLGGKDKPRGSLVKTETLPGNAARRRSKLKMNPIGGSTVTFANEGTALQKSMDINEIIEMLAQSNTQRGRDISDKDREFYSQLLEGATETDVANLLAQSNTQRGRSISDKDLEFYRSIAQGMENGGKVLQRPMFMPHGGAMHGPGGPKDDLIPVMASNGEYMLSKAAVDAAGDGSHAMGIARLDAFNKAGNKRYG